MRPLFSFFPPSPFFLFPPHLCAVVSLPTLASSFNLFLRLASAPLFMTAAIKSSLQRIVTEIDGAREEERTVGKRDEGQPPSIGIEM